MLQSISELFGEQPTIILDGSALNNPFADKAVNLMFNGHNLTNVEKTDYIEQFKSQMNYLKDIKYLLENKTVIIPSEIRDELRNKILTLRKRHQFVGFQRFSGRKGFLEQIDQFKQELEGIRTLSFNRDPRENSFMYSQIPRIKRDDTYVRLLDNATKKWREIINSFSHAGQRTDSSSAEGNLVTIAYLLKTDTPIVLMANTKTIESLMMDSFEKANLYDLTLPPVSARKIEYPSKDINIFYPYMTVYGLRTLARIGGQSIAQAHPAIFNKTEPLSLLERQI